MNIFSNEKYKAIFFLLLLSASIKELNLLSITMCHKSNTSRANKLKKTANNEEKDLMGLAQEAFHVLLTLNGI